MFPYKRVRIDWIDIITEGGWGSDKEFKDMKLATPVSEGWLFSKDDETVRIFAGYDVESDGSIHFSETIGFSNFLCEEDNSDSLTSIASTLSSVNKTCVVFFNLCHLHF